MERDPKAVERFVVPVFGEAEPVEIIRLPTDTPWPWSPAVPQAPDPEDWATLDTTAQAPDGT